MGMLAFGIVLLVLGVVLSATNFLGLAELSGPFVWIGWVAIAIGLVLAILHFVTAGTRRTDTVIEERRYRRPL